MSKKNRPTDSGGSWMDTYGDMVTLLLTFFIMLYSMSFPCKHGAICTEKHIICKRNIRIIISPDDRSILYTRLIQAFSDRKIQEIRREHKIPVNKRGKEEWQMFYHKAR